MGNTDTSYLVDGKYAIGDLVDLERLRDIFEKFTRATGFTIGFLDHPGLNVLIATGWRDICTVFHRGCPASIENCRKSNMHLLDQLTQPNQLVIEACDNGLVDCATPIIIKGIHIASLATGQLLLQKPDIERFRRQAKLFGYDEVKYLEALKEIPVVSEKQLREVTAFLGSLAIVVSELGYANLEINQEAERLEKEIAERVRVERALRESEEKYRALIETTGTGYVIIDAEGRVGDTNKEYLRLTGRATMAEVLGHKVIEWTAPHDVARNAEAVKKCAEQGFVRNLEIDYVGKDGQRIPIEINATVLPTAKKFRIITLCRDITERKRAEELRFRMETQMLQVQKLESLGVLAGGIAHDFNNLLTGILGNADLALTDTPLTSPIRGNLNDINTAARQAADLCRQMLAYSGKGRFAIQSLDLRQLVREIGHILEVSISKRVVIRHNFAENIPAIAADPSQIRQVVMNLIINASEAIGERDGVVSISIGVMECDKTYLADMVVRDDLPEGKYVFLDVTDTGCGMNAATQARIFDPFFTTKFTGRGLGLAAVLGIVRGHKGGIKIYSEEGKGTSFKVLFPAAVHSGEPHAESADESLTWTGTGTILLADDEKTVRDIAQRILERFGFRVILAVDGEEAIRLFRETEVDHKEQINCVILDLTMPRKDGEEAFRAIRNIRRDVPVILSSGYNEQEVTQKFAGKHLTGFIQKPYQVKDMITRLRMAMNV